MNAPEDDPMGPYWDGARRHRLVIQRCGGCGRYRHPPARECDACRSTEAVWTETSGRGVVHAAVVVRAPVSPLHGPVPYAGVAVELAEQPGLLVVTRLVGAAVDEARVGLPVEVVFEEQAGGRVLPQFRPARDAGTR